jgi:hypothetical protein
MPQGGRCAGMARARGGSIDSKASAEAGRQWRMEMAVRV